jgi:hypothetical protein
VTLSSTLRFFAYPANLASLLFIAIASPLLAVAIVTGLMGLPLAGILLTWTLKYGLVIAEHIAWKVEGQPVLSAEMLNPLEQRKSFVQLIVVAEMFGITWAAQYWLGKVGGALIAVLAIALLPAVVAVQTITDTALKGLDPREWYRVIRWLKRDYILVLLGVVLLWLLGLILLSAPTRQALPLVVRIAFFMFAWFSVLALLGGVILERRTSDPDDSPIERAELEVSAEEMARQRNWKIDRIYGEWRSGAHKNAWQTLLRTVAESTDPIAELRWLYERIAVWPDARLANRIAQELVPRLLGISRYSEAMTITRQRLTADPDYRPLTAQDTLHMARVARDGGDRPIARALLNDFRRIFPDDALQPAADEMAQQLQR